MTDSGWAAVAAASLATLGFTLIDSDRPGPNGSQLLVALRDRPTLRHFDPEQVTCWVAAADRGRPLTITRHEPAGDRPILWGHLHVADRLGVENRFLTFGGTLRIADVEPGLRVVAHHSPGPVVRWGGHSQGSDDLAAEIGAFFGRLIVPVDFRPGSEALLAATPAATLYAAFLVDRARPIGHPAGRAAGPTLAADTDPLAGWLHAESSRVQRTAPTTWADGSRLLGDLGLAAGP